MRRARAYLAVCVVLLLYVRAAAALPITLDFVPSLVTVTTGDLVNVDVMVSGLSSGGPPSVGAFDLDVAFDAGLLSPVDVIFGPFLGDPLFEAFTAFDFTTPGVVDFAEVSLLTPADLDALQPASFPLATLQFSAIANGTTQFQLIGDIRVDDAFGAKLPVIPEPATLTLLATGVSLLALRRRRSTRSHHRDETADDRRKRCTRR